MPKYPLEDRPVKNDDSHLFTIRPVAMRPFLPSAPLWPPCHTKVTQTTPLPIEHHMVWLDLPLGSGQPLQMLLHHNTSWPAFTYGSHTSNEQAIFTSAGFPTVPPKKGTFFPRDTRRLSVTNVSACFCLCFVCEWLLALSPTHRLCL